MPPARPPARPPGRGIPGEPRGSPWRCTAALPRCSGKRPDLSEQARSFHRAAAEYDRGRPGWPAGVLDLLPLGSDAAVLDLGAGTGKLTRVLAARYARVIAVEPLAELRSILID